MFGPFTIAGAPRFGDAINGPGQHTKRYVRTLSIPCETRTCPFAFPPDVETYSLQDRLIFNDQPLSFIVDCPTGSICPPGTWPRVITYPPGTFVFPDPVNPGFPYFISLQGCQSVVTRSLPATATPAQVLAAAQEVIQAVAAQQAECDAIGEPPPPNPIPQFVNVETYASFPCEECEVIDYDGILPWYITIDRDNDRFVLAAGLLSADSLVSANTQAQDLLNGFVDQSVADGKVTCLACTITTASPLPDATVGVVYSQGLTAIDTFEATDWSIISGVLPDGLTLNSASGNIGGTPTTEETQTFTVRATSGAQCCEKEFTLEVAGAGCVDWTTMFWDTATPFTQGGGTASFTPSNTTGDTTLGTVTCLNAVGSDAIAQGTFGHLTRNGAPCDCKVVVTIVNPSPGSALIQFGYVQVQDGALSTVFNQPFFSDMASGVYEYPFTMPDTSGVPEAFTISAVVDAFGFDQGARSHSISCFFTTV